MADLVVSLEDEGVVTVTLDRPAKKNAPSISLRDDLARRIRAKFLTHLGIEVGTRTLDL